jgi:hypothetical protein
LPSPRSDAQAPIAGGAFLHPVSLGAVVVLLANDHLLKPAFPGFVTGKLSDIAGLIFFPLLLQALWELTQQALGRAWRPSRRVLWAAIGATAVTFSLVKIWPPATAVYRSVWGLLQWPFVALSHLLRGVELPGLHRVALVADVTDLLALPALGVAAWIGARRFE